MIRGIILFCVVVFLVTCAPIDEDATARIVSFENTSDGKGNYKFSFETSNGIVREETGTLVNEGQPDEHIDVQGSVSYTDPDGNTEVFNYVANENGYTIISPMPPVVQGLVTSVVAPNVLATLLG